MDSLATNAKQILVKESPVRMMELVKKELKTMSASVKMDMVGPTVRITMVFYLSVTINRLFLKYIHNRQEKTYWLTC